MNRQGVNVCIWNVCSVVVFEIGFLSEGRSADFFDFCFLSEGLQSNMLLHNYL